MSQSSAAREFAYLCVDDFLKTFLDAQVLKSAMELGLIDQLYSQRADGLECLIDRIGCDRRSANLLFGLLRANQVLEDREGVVRLSESFSRALQFRDLLEAKLDFANLVAPDFLHHFTALLVDPGQFARQSQLFKVFDYSRCFDQSSENYEWTRRWMRFTTALTRYEAPVCATLHDFGPYRRLLDIGGNSGEFALQLCKRHPALHATVLDLPTVCAIGKAHLRHEPEADRITFIPGNALQDPLPDGFDLITFKSFLHDWPEAAVGAFLDRAVRALAPGGTILIFERGPLEIGPPSLPYSLLPMLLFARSLREPRLYQATLDAAGCKDIRVKWTHLDTHFFLVAADKPA
jgi:ubiquinone/menaquinone biosynthesis C-methylase UbiE